MLIGAGAGTWNDTAYIESAAQNPGIDYIDIPIYPINRDYLTKAIRVAEIARANNKRAVVGEAWLYKSSNNELGSATEASIFARDVFSFWQPLDVRFLTLLVQFARQNQIEFISPFWSKYFFAYLDYEQTPAGLSPKDLLRLADVAASRNIVANLLSPTGLAYKQLASRRNMNPQLHKGTRKCNRTNGVSRSASIPVAPGATPTTKLRFFAGALTES